MVLSPSSFKRRFFDRLLASQEAHRFLLNSLSVGEADSALDLDRVAEHVHDPALSRKIWRHWAEERRHARLFAERMAELGFEASALPRELDYEHWAQRYGMGTPKPRLEDPRPFDRDDLILFFSGSKAGEERACKEMAALIEDLAADPGTADLLRHIHGDEIRHVSYATEELNRLAAAGHRDQVVRTLRATRRAEARAHRRVSKAFLRRLSELLGSSALLRSFGALAIELEFLWRWCFPGTLDQPIVADAMPTPADREGYSGHLPYVTARTPRTTRQNT